MSRSVKRIMSEAKELQECPAADFVAAPLDDNLFEWHFTLRGVAGTAFEGGRYHGRIMLPPEYPFKPPSIFLLTPNGRFETGRKICLSVSAHHPESWQPAWGVRTILTARETDAFRARPCSHPASSPPPFGSPPRWTPAAPPPLSLSPVATTRPPRIPR